jgi:hypothetical protein
MPLIVKGYQTISAVIVFEILLSLRREVVLEKTIIKIKVSKLCYSESYSFKKIVYMFTGKYMYLIHAST